MHTTDHPRADETPEQTDIRMNKDVAAFGYVWIMSVVVYAARKDSRFAQFHSKQGLVLFLISIPVWIIPGIGHLLEMIVVAGMLLGFIHAAQGQYADVPLAGPLSRGELKMSEVMTWIRTAVNSVASAFMSIFKHASKDTPKDTGTPPAEAKHVDNSPVHPVP